MTTSLTVNCFSCVAAVPAGAGLCSTRHIQRHPQQPHRPAHVTGPRTGNHQARLPARRLSLLTFTSTVTSTSTSTTLLTDVLTYFLSSSFAWPGRRKSLQVFVRSVETKWDDLWGRPQPQPSARVDYPRRYAMSTGAVNT